MAKFVDKEGLDVILEQLGNKHKGLVSSLKSTNDLVGYLENSITEVQSTLEQTADQLSSKIELTVINVNNTIQSSESLILQTADEIKSSVELTLKDATDGLEEKASTILLSADSIRAEVNRRVDDLDSRVELYSSYVELTASSIAQDISAKFSYLDGKLENKTSSIQLTVDGIEFNVNDTLSDFNDRLTKNEASLNITANGITSKVNELQNLLNNEVADRQSQILQSASTIRAEVTSSISDLNGKILNNTSYIESTANSITESVKSIKEGLEGKISETEAKIKVTPESVTLLVTAVKNELSGTITELNGTLTTTEESIRAEVSRVETNLDNKISTNKTSLEADIQGIKGRVESLESGSNEESSNYTLLKQTVEDIQAEVGANGEVLTSLGLTKDGATIKGKNFEYQDLQGTTVAKFEQTGKGSLAKGNITWTDNGLVTLNSGIKIGGSGLTLGLLGTGSSDPVEIGTYVTDIVYEYGVSNSNTLLPTTWANTVTAPNVGLWLWTKVTTKYSEGDDTTKINCISYYGQNGLYIPSEGSDLSFGISWSKTEYNVSYEDENGNEQFVHNPWLSQIPTDLIPQGETLWTRVTIHFTDGNEVLWFTKSRLAIDGETTESGSGTQEKVEIEWIKTYYALSSSAGTLTPLNSLFSEDVPTVTLEMPYIWSKTATKIKNVSTPVYSMARYDALVTYQSGIKLCIVMDDLGLRIAAEVNPSWFMQLRNDGLDIATTNEVVSHFGSDSVYLTKPGTTSKAFEVTQEGNGSLAYGAINWDKDGKLSFNDKVSLSWDNYWNSDLHSIGKQLLVGTNLGKTGWNVNVSVENVITWEAEDEGVKFTCSNLVTGSGNYLVYAFKVTNLMVNGLIPNEKYVLSFDYKSTIKRNDTDIAIYPAVKICQADSTYTNTDYPSWTALADGKWHHKSVILTVNDSVTLGEKSLYIYFGSVVGIGSISFKNLKLEEGTVATSWCLAEEEKIRLNLDGKILSTLIDGDSIMTPYLQTHQIKGDQIDIDSLIVNKINGLDVTNVDWESVSNGVLKGTSGDLTVEGIIHAKGLVLEDSTTIPADKITGIETAVAGVVESDEGLQSVLDTAVRNAVDNLKEDTVITQLTASIKANTDKLNSVYTKTEVNSKVAEAFESAITQSAGKIESEVKKIEETYNSELDKYVLDADYQTFVTQTSSSISNTVDKTTYDDNNNAIRKEIGNVKTTSESVALQVETIKSDYAKKAELKVTDDKISMVVDGLGSAGITVSAEDGTGSISLTADKITLGNDKGSLITTSGSDVILNPNVKLLWDNSWDSNLPSVGRLLLDGTNLGTSNWVINTTSELREYITIEQNGEGVKFNCSRKVDGYLVYEFPISHSIIRTFAENDQYTLSFDYLSTVDDLVWLLALICDSTKTSKLSGDANSCNIIKNTWSHGKITFTIGNVTPSSSTLYYVYFTNLKGEGSLSFKNLKLEKGTIATTWCLSEKDKIGLLGEQGIPGINGVDGTNVRANLYKNSEFLKGRDYETCNVANACKISTTEKFGNYNALLLSYSDNTNAHVYLRTLVTTAISEPWIIGETYTLSVWCKASKPKSISMLVQNTNNGIFFESNDESTKTVTTDWKQFSITFTLKNNVEQLIPGDAYIELARIYKSNGNNSWNDGTILYIACPKIEHGSEATDWCPSDGSIMRTTTKITKDQIETGLITADLIGAGSIVADKIGTNAITSSKIAAGAITSDKLVSNIAIVGSIKLSEDNPTWELASDGGGHIANGAISWTTTGMTIDDTFKISTNNLDDNLSAIINSKEYKLLSLPEQVIFDRNADNIFKEDSLLIKLLYTEKSGSDIITRTVPTRSDETVSTLTKTYHFVYRACAKSSGYYAIGSTTSLSGLSANTWHLYSVSCSSTNTDGLYIANSFDIYKVEFALASGTVSNNMITNPEIISTWDVGILKLLSNDIKYEINTLGEEYIELTQKLTENGFSELFKYGGSTYPIHILINRINRNGITEYITNLDSGYTVRYKLNEHVTFSDTEITYQESILSNAFNILTVGVNDFKNVHNPFVSIGIFNGSTIICESVIDVLKDWDDNAIRLVLNNDTLIVRTDVNGDIVMNWDDSDSSRRSTSYYIYKGVDKLPVSTTGLEQNPNAAFPYIRYKLATFEAINSDGVTNTYTIKTDNQICGFSSTSITAYKSGICTLSIVDSSNETIYSTTLRIIGVCDGLPTIKKYALSTSSTSYNGSSTSWGTAIPSINGSSLYIWSKLFYLDDTSTSEARYEEELTKQALPKLAVDTSEGVKVHPIGNTNDYVHISSEGVSIVNNSTPLALFSKDAIKLGELNNPVFSVDSSGNGSFTGQVTATSGAIGGWDITSKALMYVSNDNNLPINGIGLFTEGNNPLISIMNTYTEYDSSKTNYIINLNPEFGIRLGKTPNYGTLSVNPPSELWRLGIDGSGFVANGNFTWDANGQINIGKYEDLYRTRYHTSISTTGVLNTDNIIATGGTIGNWAINKDKLTSTKTEGTNTTVVELSCDGIFFKKNDATQTYINNNGVVVVSGWALIVADNAGTPELRLRNMNSATAQDIVFTGTLRNR